MKDGILSSNILLKLYLKSLTNGGRLQLDEHIDVYKRQINDLPSNENVENSVADSDMAFRIHLVLHRLEEPYKEVLRKCRR